MRTAEGEKLLQVTAALVIAIPLTIAFVGWLMWRDWVPAATIARLPSASREEVRQLLGEPDYPRGDQDTATVWCYRRPWKIAEFQVYFGSNGRVKEYWYDR